MSDIEKIVEIGARALHASRRDLAGVTQPETLRECRTCAAQMEDLLSALTAAGYAVVPRDPTEAMQIAGATEHVAVAYTIDHKGRCITPGLIWRAMVETFSPVKGSKGGS